MVNFPELSIIVPVYNVEQVLEKCLLSIKNQTYQNYEVIMIDDGSNDKSGKICDKYMEKDNRYRVIHKKNEGVSKARNYGLDMAKGKYVMFIDSDDSILPDMFEKYINEIKISNVDVVIGGVIQYENGEFSAVKLPPTIGIQDDAIWEDICNNSEIFGYIAGKIYCLDVINREKIRLNTNMYSQEDLDFNLSVYEKCDTFKLINYAGYEYNHCSGKRVPPIWDFIANAVKIERIGNKKIRLSDTSQKVICNKICTLLFTFLYNIEGKSEYYQAINKLCSVSGLDIYLKGKQISGEQGIIVSWYLKKEYKKIYRYFYIRKCIKRLLGKPVSE